MSTHATQATPATQAARPAGTRLLGRRLAILLVLILTTTLGTTLFASSASAYVPTNYGRPGTVTVPFMTANSNNNTITFQPRTAYAVGAYGNSAQYVCFKLDLYRIGSTGSGPRWVYDNGVRRCGWIRLGTTSIYDAGYTFYLYPGSGYQAVVTTTWQLPDGTTLGTAVTGYQHTSDYRCLTTNCGTGNTNWNGGAFLMVT